jgi:excinuclease UvrABC helicase subunit UvrB
MSNSGSILDILETGVAEENLQLEIEPDNTIQIQSIKDFNKQINKLEKQMQTLAKKLEFEQAAKIRDQINFMKKNIIKI